VAQFWNEQFMHPFKATLSNVDEGHDIPLEQQLYFYETGYGEIFQIEALLKQYNAMPNLGTALDFGCGLARTANAMANHMGFQKVLCVDQSSAFLAKAQQLLGGLAGQGGQYGVMKDASTRIDFIQQTEPKYFGCIVKDTTVDFAFSILTLQHMKPQLQIIYIQHMCDALKVGGTGYLGIPVKTAVTDKALHCDIGSADPGQPFHYTEEKEVTRHLRARGCSVVGIHERADIGAAGVSKGFIFRK
jgi:SAM-dependent methyltransferase